MTENQKIILVTGSTKGIGLATAQRLAKDPNNKVVINSHRDLNDDEIKDLNSNFDQEMEIVVGDVAKESDAEFMINAIVERFGTIDGLVNNAGITDDKLLTRMKTPSFEKVLQTNLVGAFNMTKFAMKVMQKKRRGCIVNMASISGIHGNIGQANYAASKAGIIGLTKTAAQEGALRGIRCNAVAPGMVATAMTEKMGEKIIEKWSKQIPLGRFGNPDEVADVVDFLFNNQYITGQVITIDGGLTI